ncbi:MAG: metal-sensitive transcriptional regulator [Firmicutes bacterium]|nr:metal-sensitive transcriptional regulator [Bacillota bacterium]
MKLTAAGGVSMESDLNKERLLQRLKRIEGQVRGIQRMVSEEESCVNILMQVAAVRAALDKVGLAVFENHSRQCIKQALHDENGEEALEDLMNAMSRFLK